MADAEQKRYDVILADPPWAVNQRTTFWSQTAAAAYRKMSTADLCALPVRDLGKDRSVLLLWSIASTLPDALQIMEAWGYRFATVLFVWVKVTANGKLATTRPNAFYSRKAAEYVLVGRRGPPPQTQRSVADVLIAPKREHSRKPGAFFTRLDEWLGDTYPDRIELFAREARPGWDAWGDELGLFDAASASQ